jgi:hypothetical protein
MNKTAKIVGITALVIVMGILLGFAMMKRAKILYGDENCAFANCVKVKMN